MLTFAPSIGFGLTVKICLLDLFSLHWESFSLHTTYDNSARQILFPGIWLMYGVWTSYVQVVQYFIRLFR